MPALQGLTLLLLCQSLGEAAVRLLHLSLPGPVLGLLLLLGLLQWPPARPRVQAMAEVLLAHLSLLFVPVGVGVMTHLDLLASHGARMAVVLVLSTWIGLAVTGGVFKALLGREAVPAATDASGAGASSSPSSGSTTPSTPPAPGAPR